MKRREVKTFLLLSLPILIIGAMAALLSLRNIKRDLGPPYRIARHELIVGASQLTAEQRNIALSSGLELADTAVYVVEIEGRRASLWENLMWGDENIRIGIDNSSCVEIHSGEPFTIRSGQSSETREDFYSLKYLRIARGNIRCSTDLTWDEDGKTNSRTLELIVEPDALKPTP